MLSRNVAVKIFGVPAIPLYLAPQGGTSNTMDIDFFPLPAFAGMTILRGGSVRLDTDATSVKCPAQP